MYVYNRIKWKEQGAPDDELVKVWKKGEEEEDIVTNYIQDKLKMTYYRWDQSKYLSDEKHRFRGRPDGVGILKTKDGQELRRIIDIKSVSGNIFGTIRTLDDIINSKHWWHRGYYYQAQSYMGLMEEGPLVDLFSSKQKKDFKLITIPHDEGVYQSILAKCEEINGWVDKYFKIQELKREKEELRKVAMNIPADEEKFGKLDGIEAEDEALTDEINALLPELPDRIEYDTALCGKSCKYKDICKPFEIFRSQGLKLHLTDEVSIEKAKRWEELKSASNEFKIYDTWLNELGKVYDPETQPEAKVLIGSNYVITFKARKRKDSYYYVKEVANLDELNKPQKVSFPSEAGGKSTHVIFDEFELME